MTEANRGWIAAMFPAYAKLNIRTRRAAALYGNFDKVTNTVLIKRHKRVLFDNACGDIIRQETSRIITRQTECGLRQIIGTKP